MTGALAGRRGVITGGASGIGRGLVDAFAAAGATVAVFDQDAGGAQEAAAAAGPGALAFGVDVTDEAGIADAMDDAARRLGGLDFLVNNAGIRHMAPFTEHGVDVWRRTIDVNLTGTFICAQAAARIMRRARSGRIVNLASIAGELALRNRAAYNASKGGVIALTKSIAVELSADGIGCNAIAPGIIETPLSAPYFVDPVMREAIVSSTPAGRWGQVAEIAGPAVFLCSPAASFVSGTTIFVDGGWVAGKGY
jgi:NAD(P)-dependent dehydrogenase (short-subunit alcohol dehydrogenase family)